MVKKRSLKEFETMFYKKYPDSNIKIVNYISSGNIQVLSEHGMCKTTFQNLMKSGSVDFKSAINKTEYFISKAKRVHGDRYDYIKANYSGTKSKICIICPKHNEFLQNPTDHLSGNGCIKCSYDFKNKKKMLSNSIFIERSKAIHGDKYNYSLVDYKGSHKDVFIICRIHGLITQKPSVHLAGSGCNKCGNKKISDNGGWSLTSCRIAPTKSKIFESFKVYIIKCFDKYETFYKIGRTYNTIKYRFSGKSTMPYNYSVIRVFEGDAAYIYKLEVKLKKINKEYAYVPKKIFGGYNECFYNLKSQLKDCTELNGIEIEELTKELELIED